MSDSIMTTHDWYMFHEYMDRCRVLEEENKELKSRLTLQDLNHIEEILRCNERFRRQERKISWLERELEEEKNND